MVGRHKQQKRVRKRADTNALENDAHSLVQMQRATQKSESQDSVLQQPCNGEGTTGLGVILLMLQVFPMAPKKAGVASVESEEPHRRLEDIMGASLTGRLACLQNSFTSWGADSY